RVGDASKSEILVEERFRLNLIGVVVTKLRDDLKIPKSTLRCPIRRPLNGVFPTGVVLDLTQQALENSGCLIVSAEAVRVDVNRKVRRPHRVGDLPNWSR